MNFDSFIFDFDGTLAHSEPAYREAFLHSIRLHTGLEIDVEQFHDFWNVTPQEVLSRYSEEMLDEMLVSFEEHYYANHHHHLTPYDGIAELLEYLGDRGAGIAVVSLKPRRAGELEIDFTGLRSLIDVNVWGDDVENPKPAPDGVLRAMAGLGADPGSTLVIGDSPADIMMGRAAGTRTAAALWGGSSRERLLAALPDLALESPRGLLIALAENLTRVQQPLVPLRGINYHWIPMKVDSKPAGWISLVADENSLNQDRSENGRYGSQIKLRVRRCINNHPRQLIDIVRRCAGAYPTLVNECLQELELAAEISKTNVSAFASTTPSVIEESARSLLSGIEGNPVLSSWYFTALTCDRIARLRNWEGKSLAFVGTPRLYEWFRQNKLGLKRLLLDLDPVVTENLAGTYGGRSDAIINYDVADDIPEALRNSFDCVFFDPPWYPHEYLLWLKRATELAPGGCVFYSLFPELTRPSAQLERQLLLSRTREISNEVTLLSGFAEYDVPTFEAAQLDACGLTNLGAWKVADFVLAETRPDAAAGLQVDSIPRAHWTEMDIDSLRVFVNICVRSENNSNLLIPRGESTVLSSPSRRNPSRKNVNVLTSRGHGLEASRPEQLLSILADIQVRRANGESLNAAIESVDSDETTKYILANILEGAANA